MAMYGTGYGQGLAPWWTGHSDQFTGGMGALGREMTELDARKALDAIARKRDFGGFGSFGSGMFSGVQQGVPVTTTPVGGVTPITGVSSLGTPAITTMPIDPNVEVQRTQGPAPAQPSPQSTDPNVLPTPTITTQGNMDVAPAPVQPYNTPTVQPNMAIAPAVQPNVQPIAPQAAAPQDNVLNQNFMQLLQGLNLQNLFQSFQPYVQQQNPAMYSPFSSGNMGFFQPPVINPASSFGSTGLFGGIY